LEGTLIVRQMSLAANISRQPSVATVGNEQRI